MKRIAPHLSVGLFILIISLPALLFATRHSQDRDLGEKRKLAGFPALHADKETLLLFPRAFEAFVNDQFPFRRRLIEMNAALRYVLFHPAVFESVIVGRDRWLYQSFEAGADPVNDDAYAAWKPFFQERSAWFASRKIRYLFVVAPRKSAIYPENMIDWLAKPAPVNFEDRLLNRLGAETGVEIVDLRPALLDSKGIGRLFNKTDTHCNDLGAFVSYQRILQSVSRWYPSVQSRPLSDYSVSTSDSPGMDEAGMIALPRIFREDRIRLTAKAPAAVRRTDFRRADGTILGEHLFVTETDDPALPTAVVLHDSHFTAIAPFFSQHFRRVLYVWSYSFNPVLIEREHPDVVISEMVEGLPKDVNSVAGNQSEDVLAQLQPLTSKEQADFDAFRKENPL